MKTGEQYREEILQLQLDLQARIADVYATTDAGRIFFEEPWDIGAALDDATYFQASGMAQRDQRIVILDAASGSDYALENMPVEDLAWVLITLEAGRFGYVEIN